LPLDRFFFSSFDHGTFEEVAGVFEFKSEPKGLIYNHAYPNVANRIV
jgi:hypothetical protein